MTDHMKAAIEAGAKAMAPVNGNTRNFHLFPDGWLAESKAALDAMLPHIRAQVAQEIRDEHDRLEDETSSYHAQLQRDLIYELRGMATATRIAKGPQQ